MIEKIGTPAMLEQMAEECNELSQAALKLARILRGENPTPVGFGSACSNLVEEWSDVVTCADELDLHADWDLIKRKQRRFKERWKNATN